MGLNNNVGKTKECPCIVCGKMTTVTLFATPAKVKCPDCKGEKPKSVSSASSDGKKTKDCECVECGKLVTVSLFMAPAKVLCEECKKDGAKASAITKTTDYEPERIGIDFDFNMEEILNHPAIIHNPALMDIKCPACEHPGMKVIRVLDSTLWGNIIEYQCEKCKLLVTVSEQCHALIKSRRSTDEFDYTGKSITQLCTKIQSTRIRNSIEYLMQLCKDNNISINGMGVFADVNKDKSEEQEPGDTDRT